MGKNKPGLYSAVCVCCNDATITAYDIGTLHAAAKKFGWAWLNDKPICNRCLESDDPNVSRVIRHIQGIYFPKEKG